MKTEILEKSSFFISSVVLAQPTSVRFVIVAKFIHSFGAPTLTNQKATLFFLFRLSAPSISKLQWKNEKNIAYGRLAYTCRHHSMCRSKHHCNLCVSFAFECYRQMSFRSITALNTYRYSCLLSHATSFVSFCVYTARISGCCFCVMALHYTQSL